MTIIKTDVREQKRDAKRLKYMPVAPLTATNVEDALNQAAAGLINPPSITPTNVTAAMSPYTPLATDYVLLVDSTAGNVTIALAPCAQRGGRELTIKDSGLGAATHPISLQPVSGEQVDNYTNASPYPMDSDGMSVKLTPLASGGYAVTT